MKTYKLIFAKNEVLSCEFLNKVIIGREQFYEHDKGRLIYALVQAEDEADALIRGAAIIREVTEKIFGVDYINYEG